MPADVVDNSSTHGGGTIDLLQEAVWPVGLLSAHVGTAEEEGRVLVVWAASAPFEHRTRDNLIVFESQTVEHFTACDSSA